LLPAIQQALHGADEALLAVAFIDTRGIHLLEKEMLTVGSLRILATSKFDRHQIRTDTAFARAVGIGARAQLLNPRGAATFHPKMYLARRDGAFTGVIGSANLTSGLAGNYETGVVVTGTAARDAWTLANQLWNDLDAIQWTPAGAVPPDELDPRLYKLLGQYVQPGQTIQTLGPLGVPNEILAFTKTGATVATTTSPGGKDVEARMIQIAYDALVTSPTGQLTNPYLLNTLRVHRSSFVLALLAQLPIGHQVPGRPITIELVGKPPVPPSSEGL
jgi:phosphatidylserine/phosphatidylglycerophosphate/cardiolipin synthase-like enzyme